jgi:hypothetical protein
MAVRPASLSGQIAGYGSAGHAVLPEIIQDFASNSPQCVWALEFMIQGYDP